MSGLKQGARRRKAHFKKGQAELAKELLPFFNDLDTARRLPTDFWPRVMEIRNRLEELTKSRTPAEELSDG